MQENTRVRFYAHDK